MTFAEPTWLFLIPAAFILGLIGILTSRWHKKKMSQVFGASLWPKILPEYNPKRSIRKICFWTLASVFAIVALARPQWGEEEQVVETSGLDIIVTLDVSRSMLVEDVVPSRLRKAKHLIKTLIQELRGDRVGLEIFAGSAYLAAPLTTDLDYIVEILDTVNPDSIDQQGTHVGIALDTANEALQRGAENPEGESPDEGASGNLSSQVVVLISDGEDFEGTALDAARRLKKNRIQLYAMGVGTAEGKPIPIRDQNNVLRGYKKDQNGKPIMSRFNSRFLTQVAQEADGKYFDVTENEDEVQVVLKEIGVLDRRSRGEKIVLIKQERYQIPLFFALLLLVVELGLASRNRYRWAGPIAAATILMFFTPQSVRAQTPSHDLDSYLKNEKGIRALEDRNLEKAEEHFGQAQVDNPNAPELFYNQGVVQMKKGDFKGALQSFQKSQESATQADPKISGRIQYNLGSVLEKQGNPQAAVGAYLNAIRLGQLGQDKELEEEARKKLENLVIQQQQQNQNQSQDQKQAQNQQQQQQQQQQNQDQKDQDKNQQDQANNDQKQEKQDDQKQDSQKSQSGQNQAQSKPKFDSEELSKEDAEKVLSKLEDQEKETLSRFRSKNMDRHPEKNYKDW